MPARVEQCLLSFVVQYKCFGALIKNKITADYFFDPQCRDLYDFLHDYYRRSNTTPDSDLMTQYRGQFQFIWGLVDDIDGMCRQLRQAKIRIDVLKLSDQLRAAAESNPSSALDMLRSEAVNMANEHVLSNDLLLTDAGKTLKERYESTIESGGVIGIPWPWEILTVETRGLQNGHYVVLYGRPKTGKTWVGILTAANALMRGFRVLFYSMEMSSEEILERITCALAKVDFDLYYKNQLHKEDPEGYQRLWQYHEWIVQMRDYARANNSTHVPDILATCDSEEGGGGVTSLRAKIREFKPALVIVDSVYLMKDDRGKPGSPKWDAMTNISRDLKRTAQQFSVPLIAITQGNRLSDKDHKNADLREIGYADAPSQDADLILRTDRKKNADTHETEQIISIVGFRHGAGKLEAFANYFHPCVNTEFKRIITSDDAASQPPPKAKTTTGRTSGVFSVPTTWYPPGAR